MKSLNGKKELTINRSLFANLADSFAAASSCLSPNKSPRIFQDTSVVGLSIVAAMITDNSSNENILSSSSSRPIPIVCSSAAAKKPRVVMNNNIITDDLGHRQADVLSEGYTCVISHFGNNLVHKRVFFDDAGDDVDVVVDDDDDDDDANTNANSVFFASSSPMNVGFEIKREFWSRDFLSSCFLCRKKLHGLDIFMYRGENAFCSAECRDKHITSDDLKENCGFEARKQLDYSVSPCSRPHPIFAGVTVA